MPSFGDEESAWSAALGGDAEAFAAVFDQTLNRAYRHALRLTGNGHDAEDLVAAAFMELWRCRRRVRVVDGSVGPWLLVTVTNLERNRKRSLRRYRSLLASMPRGEATNPGADSVVDEMAADDVVDHVREALRQLSASDAALVALVHFEECTPAQAAEVLGIAAGAARTRLHRARRRLAAALGEDPSHPGPKLSIPESLR